MGTVSGQARAVMAPSPTVSVILRTRVLPAWAGWLGLVASAFYLINQGDILSTAVSSFPGWDLGGLVGSYLWAVWLIALGVLLPRRTPNEAF